MMGMFAKLKIQAPPTALVVAILAWIFGKRVSGATLQQAGQLVTAVLAGTFVAPTAGAIKQAASSASAKLGSRRSRRTKAASRGAPKPETLRGRLLKIGVLAQWPTKWVLAASLVDGALTVLNQTTFGFPTIWKTTVTVFLGLFAFLGIGPLLGPKFKAALHIPPKAATGIGVALTLLLVAVQQNVGLPGSAIIICAINVAGALGFSPAFAPTV